MSPYTPIEPFINRHGYLLLDGGLATELEQQGFVLDTPLWSAELLRTTQGADAIRAVQLADLRAGANCITTASYQASIPGLLAGGFSPRAAAELLHRSITLANEARTLFRAETAVPAGLQPLVAGSIGPYGAFLADGSEYRGDYRISKIELADFHAARFELLADAVPATVDLLAIETIPDITEAEALRDLLLDRPAVFAWVSFCCRDGLHLCDGTLLREAAALFAGCANVVAVGVNCTAPQYVLSLIGEVRSGAPSKHIIVYPNSGERYDGETRQWVGTADAADFGTAAQSWYQAGARLIGGCCRTGPAFVRAVREVVGGERIGHCGARPPDNSA